MANQNNFLHKNREYLEEKEDNISGIRLQHRSYMNIIRKAPDLRPAILHLRDNKAIIKNKTAKVKMKWVTHFKVTFSQIV